MASEPYYIGILGSVANNSPKTMRDLEAVLLHYTRQGSCIFLAIPAESGAAWMLRRLALLHNWVVLDAKTEEEVRALSDALLDWRR